MALLSKIIGLFSAPPSPPTQEELDKQALDRRQCPDCGTGQLLLGPRGGAAANVACPSCLSEFNILIGPDNDLHMLKRMEKLSFDRAKLYGITAEQWTRIHINRQEAMLAN